MCALLKHFRQNALNFITETSINDSENGKAPVQQTLHPKKKEDKEREEATKKDLNFFSSNTLQSWYLALKDLPFYRTLMLEKLIDTNRNILF